MPALYLKRDDLTRIAVSVEDLYNIALQMKNNGERVAMLEICEPMDDIELGKHISFEAVGQSVGGVTDYELIEAVSVEEAERALWCE